MSPRLESAGPASRSRIVPGPASFALFIAMGMFFAGSIALIINLTRQRDAYGWVQHTNDVLRTIAAVERRFLEAEWESEVTC